MGQECQDAFPEIYPAISAQFEQAEIAGVGVNVTEPPLMTVRSDYAEETYFTGGFVLIRDSDGNCNGFYNYTYEVTRSVLMARRSALLNRMIIPSKFHKRHLADQIFPALETVPTDVTMALLYEVDEESSPGSSKVILRGNLGVPPRHEISIEDADLDSLPLAGLIPDLRNAKTDLTD